jgi:predicted nucleic acid-binding protein
MFVIDASVFVKLFKVEDDSHLARSFIDTLVRQREPFLAPSIAVYEALASAMHVQRPFSDVLDVFDELRLLGLLLEEPGKAELTRAEMIATTRSPIGGYPTRFDSIYHAMANERGATFITADRRHVEKTRNFGGVLLLADWKPA